MSVLVTVMLGLFCLWTTLFLLALRDVLSLPKNPKRLRVRLKVLNARIPTPFRLKQTLSVYALYSAIAVLAWPAVAVWWVGLRWRSA